MSKQQIVDTLARFGWDVTDSKEFWDKYYKDPWVYNLTNALVVVAYPPQEAEPE